MRRRSGVRDSGFTLLETIVVVLLVSVLASVMVAVVAVIVRNAPSTEASVENSHSYQVLITWLARDAASTPPDEFTLTTPAPSCSGISGPTLVQMSWTLEGSEYVAGYRLQPDGDGQRITRYTCSGPVGASPFPDPRVTHVTDRLHNAVPDRILDGSTVVGVTIELTMCLHADRRTDCTKPGQIVSVAARSHNPGPTNTLPSP